MANIVFRDTLIGGYLAVKGLSVINKQSKTITVIKKWQQLWVVLGQANTAQWVLAIYHDKNNWMHSQKPLTVYQFVQLHSFTDKQTYDGLHMFLLKFAGGHKISFACVTQKQKSEWLTAVQKALNACYNKKQQKESRRSVTDDDWWQLSEHQDNTPEFKEFQVVLSSCSLPGNVNRCRVCLFPNQSCIEVYGYSTYSSYTVRWTWQYSQLYCISFDKKTLTLTVQLYISDQLEELCWTGNEVLHLYNFLCNVSGVWDCTAQTSEATVDDILPTLVRLEESDYTSVGVILPDYLVQQMKDWYLVELVYYQHQPQLLGQYEVQLSLTHLHLKGCNSPHCWSWELHHIKSYSLDTDQYLIIEVEGTSDVWSGVFHFGDIGSYDGHITTLYQLLQQLMVKLYLVVMIKQQLIVTRKQLSALMNSDQSLHSMIECFSCELLEGPSQELLGHYTLQIFIDQIRVITSNAKWVWLLTDLYSYKLDQEEVGGATYVTIQISNSASAVIEEWVWSGNHMIRFYSFLLELCQLLSRQSCQEILIRQVVTIRLMTSQTVTINTYTIQLTKDDLMLIDADNQQVICSYPLECIKRLNLDEGKNELIVYTSESTTLQPSELVIAADNAQELTLLINKAVQNKQQLLNAQVMTRGSSLGSHQSQTDTQLPSNYREIACQVSHKQVSTESQEAEYQTPAKIHVQHSDHLISAHQIPAGNQQVPVKTMCWYPIETDHTSANTIHKTNWNTSHQQLHSAGTTKQEMVKTSEIKHQISANGDNQVTPWLPEAQQQVLTEVHKIEHHSSSGFQQIQDNRLLHETQLPTHEVVESKQQIMIKPQEKPEQPHTQIQHTLLNSQQAHSEIPQVSHEDVLSDETHKVSYLLMEDITQTKTGEMPQVLESQQLSTEKEIPLQPSLQLPVPNQNAYESPTKIDEAKGENEQEYTPTESWHVMQQTDDTQVSVGAQVKQNITVNTSQTPNASQINTQLSSHKIMEEESEHQVAVIAQQTLIVSDQATFQTPGEASNYEPMDQTQHISMETIETVCQYPNTEETSTNKPRVVQGPTEISSMLNDSRNTALLLATHNVSHLLVEDIAQPKTGEMSQAEIEQISLQSQQISTEKEIPLQPSLEAQLLQAPNQNYEPPVKLDEVTREIRHVVTEGEEEQEYILTERQHVMQQTSPVSVRIQQNLEPTSSYLPQVEDRFTVNTLQAQDESPKSSSQNNELKIVQMSNELEEESTYQVAVISQQTLNVSNQTTLIPGEIIQQKFDNETMDQHVPMKTTETVHQYPNIEETPTDKPRIEISNESRNTVLLQTQQASCLLVEDIPQSVTPQAAEVQHSLTGPILSIFPTSGKTQQASDDDTMDHTQQVPMETIETIHQYPNIQETSTDKPRVVDTKEEQMEISQMSNESANTVLLQTQKVSHVFVEDVIPTETGGMPQAEVEQTLLKSQQISTENKPSVQPSLEAHSPNQIANEPPVKLDKAKEITHEIQHVVTVTEGEEQQEYILTEHRHVMQLTSVNTPVSVRTQQNLEPTLYTLQPQVEQGVTVDTLQTPHKLQLNTQTNSQKIIDNEQQQGNKHQFAVLAQQEPIIFDQTTFQTPGRKAYDKPMEQTQHISMETIETVHQYKNNKVTSNDKQKPTEIPQVPNESTNTVLLLKTQKVSHLLNTPTEDKETPQAEVQLSLTDPQQTLQQADNGSGDICSTETMPHVQLLNKNSDKHQDTHCTINENQPMKIHRKLPDVDQAFTKTQAVTRHVSPVTMQCGQTGVEFQPQSQNQQAVETPRESLEVTEVIYPQDMVTETQEIAPHKMVEESPQEAQVGTCQVSDTIWEQVSPETEEEDITKLIKSQHTNEVAKSTQAFVMVDATSTESTTQRFPNMEDQMTIETSNDTQEIFVGPDKLSQQLPAEVMNDQPQNLYRDPLELMSDEVHGVKHKKLLVEEDEEALQEHPQVHSMSGKTLHINSGQSQPAVINTQTSIEIHKVECQEQVQNEPHNILGQLAVETEQQMMSKSLDYNSVPAEPTLDKCAQIIYENTIMKPQNISPKMQETFYGPKENPQCSTKANTPQLLNDSPQDIVCSSSPQQQPLLAPNDEGGQQPIKESDKVSRQFIDDNHKVVMMETHHCITSTDAPVTSCEADITHQSSILQVMPDNLEDILYQAHEWCSSETQHISDSTSQPAVMLTEQTMLDTDQPVTDERQCVEVETLCTSEKISDRQFPKTAQEVSEPQSVIMHEVVMDAMPTSVHVVQHPPNDACHVPVDSKQTSQETPVETYHEPQVNTSNTQELPDQTAEQILRQPVEKDNAQITTNIQASSSRTHDRVKDDQVTLAIQSTPDTIYTTTCQLAPTSMFEPQKTSLQQSLQQISREKSQKLQTEAFSDEDNVDVDQPITLETDQEILPSSQQVLFTTEATHHKIQQTLNTLEHSQLLINVQDQTQKNEPQQITYQLPEAVEEHHKLFETECTSVKTPEIVSQIPVGTTPQTQSTNTHQEATLDNRQNLIMSTEKSSLGINDDVKEAAEIPTKTKEVKQCFKFNSNQISHKTSPFSVEVRELSIKDDSISCQPMAKTQQPALNKAQFETQQMAADKKTCLEAQQSVLYEISIDYREKTVETRKTFYKTSTPDDPHTFEHLFSIEAKQQLSSEQLQPQQISFKTQESTHRVLDEPQPTLAESERLEKEQISVETQLHVSNKEILNETQKVFRAVEISADEEKTQRIIPPVETITAQEPHIDNMPEAKKYTSPLVVEYDEDVMIIDFTSSDHVTKHSFIIAPSNHICYHYQLYADEDVTSTGEEISTCTIHCCSYHILVKIEKVSQKKKFNAALISAPQHQYDLQSTRKAIDELLLKYL